MVNEPGRGVGQSEVGCPVTLSDPFQFIQHPSPWMDINSRWMPHPTKQSAFPIVSLSSLMELI